MLRASSPASVEPGGAKGQSDRTNKEQSVLLPCVFATSQTLTNSFTDCHRPESASQMHLNPRGSRTGRAEGHHMHSH